jgi:hypothetical protein
VSILLGNGDGTFQAPLNFPTGQSPELMAVGDFNGDGKADLAIGNWLDQTVSVLLGNGDGTFQPKVDYSLGDGNSRSNGPNALVVGDFNGDGRQDIAVGNLTGAISILLGNGDGTFQTAATYPSGASTLMQIANFDFNGDGVQDLAIVDESGSVTVILGKGDGSFQTPQQVATGCNGESIAVGEFNGDGRADLAVTSECGTMPMSTPDYLTVFLGASPGVTAVMKHASDFVLGQTNATYTVTVGNDLATSAATSGAIIVTENLPTGLTLVAMAGDGWTCPSGTAYCTRGDSLNGGSSYPPIVITVAVNANAPSTILNQVTISGAASATATDATTIVSLRCDLGGPTSVIDLQDLVDEALGVSSMVHDLNGDGMLSVTDVQIAIGAALRNTCVAN